MTVTPEPVTMYLQLDRAIGEIVGVLGVAKSSYSSSDEKDLKDALERLDQASDYLQKWIYDQCGVK